MPSPSQQYYINAAGGYLLGPYGTTPEDQGSTISYRSDYDTLEESKGIYAENTVDHRKLDGQFSVNPAMGSAKPAPLTQEPNRITISMKDISNKAVTLGERYGVLYDGSSTRYYDTTSKTTVFYNVVLGTHYNCMFGSNRYSVPNKAGKPTADIAYSVNYYTFTGMTAGKVNIRYKFGTMTIPKGEFSDYSDLSSPAFIQRMLDKYGSKVSLSSTNQSYSPYTLANPADVIMSEIRKVIDSEITMASNWDLHPVDNSVFGELAMDAVKKIDRNNVNMIAFLRDLREPSALIPKLKSLVKLKGAADNYLTVEYGILPTISDLKGIVDAFQKVKPYVDRNGFSTYSAVRSSFEQVGQLGHTIEQRIKVAVQDNDSMMINLIDRIESAGFGLTFQNIWDLVPYSFVLDWFIDVGGMLERVDTRLRMLRMDIPYVTQSFKQTLEFPALNDYGTPLIGSMSLTRYKRWAVDHCPVPAVFTSGPPTAANHWLEATALLMQRSK